MHTVFGKVFFLSFFFFEKERLACTNQKKKDGYVLRGFTFLEVHDKG